MRKEQSMVNWQKKKKIVRCVIIFFTVSEGQEIEFQEIETGDRNFAKLIGDRNYFKIFKLFAKLIRRSKRP
jgi:hypothetical protein